MQVIKTVKAKIGMRSDAECFTLYEIMSSSGTVVFEIMSSSDTVVFEIMSSSGTVVLK